MYHQVVSTKSTTTASSTRYICHNHNEYHYIIKHGSIVTHTIDNMTTRAKKKNRQAC